MDYGLPGTNYNESTPQTPISVTFVNPWELGTSNWAQPVPDLTVSNYRGSWSAAAWFRLAPGRRRSACRAAGLVRVRSFNLPTRRVYL